MFGPLSAVNLGYSGSMQGAKPVSSLRLQVTWLVVIVGIVVFINLDQWLEDEEAAAGLGAAPAARVTPPMEMVGKLSLGVVGAMPAQAEELKRVMGDMQDGSFIGDVAASAFALRLGDHEGALRLLDVAEHHEGVVDDDRPLTRALHAAITAAASGTERDRPAHLSETEQAILKERLGWFGEQAIWAAENPGSVTVPTELSMRAFGLIGFGIAGVLGGIIGFGWLVTLLILSATGRIQSALRSPPQASQLLLELFAAWMITHIVVVLVAAMVVPRDQRLGGGLELGLTMVAATLPIAALFWVRLRGANWAEIRRELGLVAPTSWPKEIGIGFLTWLSGIPLLGIGLLISFALGALLGSSPTDASHPVQEAIAEGSMLDRVVLMILAAGIAPVIEEIFFRGALYGHLRTASKGLGLAVSIAISAVISSSIFAMIHPQGITFAPVLAGLAIAFCLAREWRGSLVAPMAAHAMNNATIVGLNIFLFS